MSDNTTSIMVQNWTESERGWGQRPDGCTCHLTMEDCRRFREDYIRENHTSPSVPDEYSFPDGKPYCIDAPVEFAQILKELRDSEKPKFGIWLIENQPNAGIRRVLENRRKEDLAPSSEI